ncbi:hypothetical protein CGLAUT_08560 [Corynebacterium glaucum]|uniref:hypothetical protein n=1 Tax=Corynebacterium glaucum TaxID=187491 RepID=UPI0025B3E911|nr:hypothetical protein [Corynebacterium glaucum]WJZ08193.1 hypothetical protein CGLAUT_08560 [Corynebacterium glaucum]
MQSNVYTRRLNGSTFWVVAIILIGAAVALAPLMLRGSLWEVLLWLVFVFFTLACLTSRVKLVVDDEQVRFSIFGFSDSVPLSAIVSLKQGPEITLKHGAWVRFIDNATGYVVPGPTVQIETSTTKYLVSASDPEAAIRDIQGRTAPVPA